jgi:cytochrome b561
MQTDFLRDQLGRNAPAPARPRHSVIQATPIHAQRPPFDSITRGLHWATAVLVLALFATAWLHALAEGQKSDLTPFLLQIHRSIGVVVWTLTAFRLTWRLTFARLPAFPAQMTTLHRTAVKASEYALYALLLAQPATGLLATLFGGRPFALLIWQIPPLFPRDDATRAVFLALHELGAWTLAILVAAHAGVALVHHFVLRDDVLACMASGLRRGKASSFDAGNNGPLRGLVRERTGVTSRG